MPGALTNHDSIECECCAPFWVPPPAAARITMGRFTWPPNMYRAFEAWLMIWSIATIPKFRVMSSATGRRPVMAAPIATPMIAASAIGVSRTRRAPNSAISPSVARKVPPTRPTSSPRMNTRSSRAISSASARCTAS